MDQRNPSAGLLDEKPRATLMRGPTSLEPMPNLAAHLGREGLHVKRDDLTGLAFGGNKVRQLEFYLGEARDEGADTILITGAVQSNFVRLAAAAARKFGLQCHIQLEERVAKNDPTYHNSGNVLIDRLLGATLHSYPSGDDEEGADRNIREIAAELGRKGRKTYVIPLAPGHAPLGALGYVDAARELLEQAAEQGLKLEDVVVASGSGHTHAGLLFGLRAFGSPARVTGVCVRRASGIQRKRIVERVAQIAELLDMACPVLEADVILDDSHLAPGYGRMSDAVMDAMRLGAETEALMLDPVYTAKAFAGFLDRARASASGDAVFIHTGGTPGIFAYEKELTAACARPRG
ncbi:MAG: D-cysteine desulfhydrase family protein [Pseudomonadota bacterium]|nr:D-cysteine desulfhydrase family protein [Pseudomonadota bacterium]